MVNIMPKVCTTNINKGSELRQQIKTITDLTVLKKTNSAWIEEVK